MGDFDSAIAEAEGDIRQAKARIVLLHLAAYAQTVQEAYPHVVYAEFPHEWLDEPVYDSRGNRIDDFSVRRFLRQTQRDLDVSSGLPMSGFMKFHYEGRRVVLGAERATGNFLMGGADWTFTSEHLDEIDEAMRRGADHCIGD